tara:strand:+ start:728 stop:1279 length:552 start_codon:yes stop_codon:yes gene_type:complete
MLNVAEILCYVLISIGMPRAEFACTHMETLVEAAEENELRPELLIAMIYVESNWNHRVVSRANACGLTQVLPKYTKNPKLTCNDLKDPETSIDTGAKTLNYWVNKYGKGNERVGLCGYLAGFRCKGKDKNNTGYNRYAPKVLKKAALILREFNHIHEELESGNVKPEDIRFYECTAPSSEEIN